MISNDTVLTQHLIRTIEAQEFSICIRCGVLLHCGYGILLRNSIMNSLKHFLRIRAPFIFKFARAAKHLPSRMKRVFTPYRLRTYAEPFHGDKQWQELVALFAKFPITSCVETGTYHADTTLYLAKVFPNIPVYTVELAGEYYRESVWRLRDSSHTFTQ